MADIVSIDNSDGRVLVIGSDGFRAVRENDVWSSLGSIPITGADLAETFRSAADGTEASELSKAARAAVSS